MEYQVFLDHQSVEVLHSTVYPAPYNEYKSSEFVILTGSGEHELKLRSNCPIRSVTIRPLSLRMQYTLEKDGLIRIPLSSPANFSVEITSTEPTQAPEPLLVFYSPQRKPAFCPDDPHIIYFPQGIHNASVIEVCDDNTLMYLEEGAWVKGRLTVHDCSGFHLCGHGVLTQEDYPNTMRETHPYCVDVINCRNVRIEDVTLTDSVKWTCRIFGCDSVHIDNLKIIGCRGNSDGVDICGSRNVLVERIFTRTWDDSLVVKAFDTGNVENITFRDCTLWNDFARPIEVGVELRADEVKNVLFDNIDVIHSPTGYPIMGIHHGDRALVSGITFRNIRIEDTPGAQLFDIRITDSVWNEDARKGRIESISFENISLIGNPGLSILPEKSRLQGFSAECDIRNVSFKNISILGYAVTNLEEANLLIMDHVNGVSIENNLPLPSVGHVAADIGWAYAPICGPDGIYRGVVRMTFENQSGAPIDCAPRLVISPANTARFSAIPHALSLAPGQSAALEIPVSLPAGRYVLRIQDICPATDSAWQMITLPLKLNVSGTGLGFVNCYGDRLADIRASVSHDELLLSSAVISRKDAHLIVYSAMPAEEFEGEVKFTVEETDFAEAPAILLGKHGLELAPQLRCPAEITYVFKNEPRVKEIRKNVVPFSEDGCARLSFDTLGLEPNAKEFWLEVEAVLPETQKYRYPYTLFHSVKPGEIAHMFGHVEIVG